MKKSTFLILCICALSYNVINAQWNLVWQDEFNGSISSDWVIETGTGNWGWGNNEQQYYRSENISVVNNMLQIQARNENFGGMNYTSGRMKTQGRKTFKYGKIEARIAMPAFNGVWPAFWMLGSNIGSVGWPACGEIDIMEHVNTEQRTHGTIHWDAGGYASYGGFTDVNVTAFHVYGIEWDDQAIRWFVDGRQYHEVNIAGGVNSTHEFHNDFFIILNMAIGGQWPGYNIDNSAMPANMLVDYVRVYEKTSGSSYVNTIEAENYSVMNGVQTEQCSEGGLNVGWIDPGDWMAFNNINIPASGLYTVEYRVASQNGGQLSLDLNAGSVQLGAVNIPATWGWQNWTTVKHHVHLNAGTYNFGIFAPSGGWNINWWRISQGLKSASILPSSEEVPGVQPSISPNPAGDVVNVSGLSGYNQLEIYNMNGVRVLVHTVDSAIETLNVSGLNAGLYLVKLSNKSEVTTLKMLKL